MKVLHAWAAIEQGKTGNSLGISDLPAFPQNEISEAAEFWTRLNGASIVFPSGCATWKITTELNIESEKSQQSGTKGEHGNLPRGAYQGKLYRKAPLKILNCSSCTKGGLTSGQCIAWRSAPAARAH